MNSFTTDKAAFLQETLPQLRLAVLGDIMLDRYYFGEVKRISPEAPVPVARITSEKDVLGGAANVAHNLSRLGCQVRLIGLTGLDDSRRRLVELLQQSQISDQDLLVHKGPTVTKLRILGGHQQMLRLDFEDQAACTSKEEKKLLIKLEQILCEVDGLIISDYNKGVCSPKLCQEAIRIAQKYKLPIVVDPKGQKWKKYRNASYITPNVKELGEALKKSIANEDKAIAKGAQQLLKSLAVKGLIVTRSEKGMSLIAEQEIHIPTVAQEVFDVSGAGDTVIAVLGAALAAKIPVEEALHLANLAAGIVVGKLGTYAIGIEELLRKITLGDDG